MQVPDTITVVKLESICKGEARQNGSQVLKYKCADCAKNFKNIYDLGEHLKIHYPDDKGGEKIKFSRWRVGGDL